MHLWMARAATALALSGAALAASAANVTLTGWTYGSGNSVHATYGIGQSYAGAAGGFTGSLSGTPGGQFDTSAFNTYCIELTEHFSFSSNPMLQYSVVDGASYFGGRYSDASKATALGKLLTYVSANPTMVDTAAESTAMQLAVWNLVYDTDFTVSSGSFADTSAYKTQANALLAGAAGVTTSLFSVYALEKAGSQDFLLAVRNPPAGQTVPEPASLVLVALGLMAAFFARQRASRQR